MVSVNGSATILDYISDLSKMKKSLFWNFVHILLFFIIFLNNLFK